ncbi:hypothetical protein [Mesoterricola sediminis]|uniref:Uncharacterized protein n=1 Tax=Mesoterricola sediminis TaxID=2927980 RepID=A0AA48KBU5_9BACT|nr:hypothetical protein [Mesoterricola sediminis]BDU76474.1 hypothetical protein METESE_14320 [Mesoterricola sediminis]
MDILTLELVEVTVSEALREIARVLEAHPGLPLRILTNGDEMLLHNVQRFLDRAGRITTVQREQGRWRVDTAPRLAPAPAPPPAEAAPARPPAPRPAPAPPVPVPQARPAAPAPRPLLLTRPALGSAQGGLGRRLLLGLLREAGPDIPWVGLALEATQLLEDPEALAALRDLRDRGVPVRVSRASLLFPDGPEGAFEVLEDSLWQRLAARGELTLL